MPRNHVNFPVAGMRYRIFEQQWKQVILCWLGRKDIKAQKKEEFIRALVEFKGGVRDFYGYQAYLLAAAGINQFKACSLATEMVRQVVKWGFGYFNTEKQEWRTFLDPIKEAAREVIPQTIRPLAIAVLLEIIRTTENENSRRWAADSLGKIDPGNPKAIAVLLEIIRTTENENSRRWAADSLGKIDPGNSKAIAGLLEIIGTTEDKFTRIQAADSLGKILTTPEQYAGVVSALKDCLSDETYRDNFKRFAKCYKLICNCAENLPYPEFYQPWHNLPTTPHP
ncbi:HEAT repeat domain-containing protein [Limnospira platensis]